jgi:dTMP kinase
MPDVRIALHREPSSDPIGRLFRTLSTSHDTGEGSHEPMMLALLSAADRHSQQHRLAHLAEAGTNLVISDRYYLSGLAYHAVDGIAPQFYQQLNQDVRRPDLYLFLDVDPATAAARRPARPFDRWESDAMAAALPAAYEQALHLVQDTEDAAVVRLDAEQPFPSVLSQAVGALRSSVLAPPQPEGDCCAQPSRHRSA